MNILFIYDAPLRPEVGGTERATMLVMEELSRRHHVCKGILHFDQTNPNKQYLNGEEIESVYKYLYDNRIDIVVNQIAFHPRFLRQFLALGGQRWKSEGGAIISFMHLDPTPAPKKKIRKYFCGWKEKSLYDKIKRLLFLLYLPFFNLGTDIKYKNGLRFLYDNSDFYILLSRSFLGIFTKLTKIKSAKKIRFIPNMLTFPEIQPTEIIEKKENIVLVVARLDDEQKNISFIIEIWKKIKNHKGYVLHIIGNGRDKQLLERKAVGVPDIVFEGAQSPLEWYKKAKISLMASPREGWGLTITEGLQNGVIPIVLNTSTVFKDIITAGENGFLPNNAKEFISCIEKLITDKALANKIAINALSSASRFSQRNIGNLWDSVLNEIHNNKEISRQSI